MVDIGHGGLLWLVIGEDRGQGPGHDGVVVLLDGSQKRPAPGRGSDNALSALNGSNAVCHDKLLSIRSTAPQSIDSFASDRLTI